MPVLSATDIAPGDLIPVTFDGLALLLVADEDGAVYCTASCRCVIHSLTQQHMSRLCHELPGIRLRRSGR